MRTALLIILISLFKVNIWEERKVFGSRGQILKEELLGRQPENGTRNGVLVPLKLVSQSFYTSIFLASFVNKVHHYVIISTLEFCHDSNMINFVIFAVCSTETGKWIYIGESSVCC